MSETSPIIDRLCAILQAALPNSVRGVKWNAPNFSVNGRDLITLNLAPNNPVRVVFHRGAKAVDTKTGLRMVADASGRLVWATDQRAFAAFPTLAEVETGAEWLSTFAAKWVQAVQGD